MTADTNAPRKIWFDGENPPPDNGDRWWHVTTVPELLQALDVMAVEHWERISLDYVEVYDSFFDSRAVIDYLATWGYPQSVVSCHATDPFKRVKLNAMIKRNLKEEA